FLLALPAGAIVGGIAAVIVGLPALRLRGLHLAVSTLAFAVATSAVLVNPSYFGKGLPRTFPRPSILGINLDNQKTFYYTTLALLIMVIFGVVGLRRSRIGRVLIAARDNERTV